MAKKPLILSHGDELLIHSDKLNYPLCNISGHVAVSRIYDNVIGSGHSYCNETVSFSIVDIVIS